MPSVSRRRGGGAEPVAHVVRERISAGVQGLDGLVEEERARRYRPRRRRARGRGHGVREAVGDELVNDLRENHAFGRGRENCKHSVGAGELCPRPRRPGVVISARLNDPGRVRALDGLVERRIWLLGELGPDGVAIAHERDVVPEARACFGQTASQPWRGRVSSSRNIHVPAVTPPRLVCGISARQNTRRRRARRRRPGRRGAPPS